MRFNLLNVIIGISLTVSAFAQSTGFTYQGRLNHGGTPASNLYEITFTLYDSGTNGNTIGTPITLAPVPVTNGLFTAYLDFGGGAFNGTPRWIEIAVTLFGSDQPIVTLSPRQPVTPAPYAIVALEARAIQNPSFLGTTNFQGVILRVNNEPALRLEPTGNFDGQHGGIVNVIGGSFGNAVLPGVYGGTIAGGGAISYESTDYPKTNQVAADFGTIGGGALNTIEANARFGTIAGGWSHRIGANSAYTTVGGGSVNEILADSSFSFIGGGEDNWINHNSPYSVIVGGHNNVIHPDSIYATIAGGQGNRATNYAFAAGYNAYAEHTGSFVWSDRTSFMESTAPNQFAVRATGGVRFETAGAGMTIDGEAVPIGPITAHQIAEGAITATKLAANSVTGSTIASHSITASNMVRRVYYEHSLDPIVITNPIAPSGRFGSFTLLVGDKLFVGGSDTNFANMIFVFGLDGQFERVFPAPASDVFFGFSSAAVGADKLLIGSLGFLSSVAGTGAAYLLSASGSVLTAYTNPEPDSVSNFGFQVATIGTDKIAVSAANPFPTSSTNHGKVYIFDLAGTLLQTLSSPSELHDDGFGFSICAIGADKILVGAPFSSIGGFQAGVAYLITIEGALVNTFTNPASQAEAYFGLPVAAVGSSRIVIGAPYADSTFTNAGALHVFDLDGNFVQTILNPAPAQNAYFGFPIGAINNEELIVGASGASNTLFRMNLEGERIATVRGRFSSSGGYANLQITTGGQLIVPHPAEAKVFFISYGEYTPNLIADGARAQSVTAASLKDGAALLEISDNDGAGSGLDADLLDGLNSTSFWLLGGNSNISNGFVGTLDAQPLEFRVNNHRALLLAPAHDGSLNVIAGGRRNFVPGGVVGATISGGGATNSDSFNSVESHYGVIGGGLGNSIGINSFASVIAGGANNCISNRSSHAAIAGGYSNNINTGADYTVIGGGYDNTIGLNSVYGTIAGGYFNHIGSNAPGVTIAGGRFNVTGTNASHSVIGGGQNNNIRENANHSTIAGGEENQIGTNAAYSVIGGGNSNNIAGNASHGTIPGGSRNNATNFAFAAGHNARAVHTGAFVWSDSVGTTTTSAAPNTVTMRARGGFRFLTGAGSAGAELPAGGTAWGVISDRDAKKNFTAVDAGAVLEKLADVPVQRWNYAWERDDDPPHLGPTAQDFKAAFYPGRDDKAITTLEADGVALAAIQGLNQKLQEELKRRDAENEELKRRVAALERLFSQVVGAKTK